LEESALPETTPRPGSGDEQSHAARQVLAGAFHGVLATHSLDLPGYPFGSVVPYVLDGEGLPLLLLSRLSQHTKNLDADRRCGLTVVEAGEGDVQQRGRLSAVGDVSPGGADADAERYFRYFPQTRMYFEQLDFHFHRFTPRRFHWNGGFATARWFGADRIVRANPFAGEVEARILAHMNRDHADALRTYLTSTGIDPGDADVEMLGIDAEGIDLRAGERLHRVPLPRAVASAAEARAVLVEMASPQPP
jgi:putative heme iron utilization protein